MKRNKAKKNYKEEQDFSLLLINSLKRLEHSHIKKPEKVEGKEVKAITDIPKLKK